MASIEQPAARRMVVLHMIDLMGASAQLPQAAHDRLTGDPDVTARLRDGVLRPLIRAGLTGTRHSVREALELLAPLPGWRSS
ncbi:hypothetical protein [Streptomyces sp. TRM49041]|uniref:hypothetical protein n=1 Tax=Streptomyces sp. TRM49041 TaxID=2603216 RepID=UPI0011EBBB75|nr:hypothetical protein [Streptomyces sp. TRM49041]